MTAAELISKAQQSGWRRRLLNFGLQYKIPFNRPHGFRIEHIEDESLTIALPYWKINRNHINGMHACALATLCEYISGLSLVRTLDEKKFRIILSSIFMTYHYQAKSKVKATFSVTKDFVEKEIITALEKSDSVFKAFNVEVYDENQNHICTGQINWQIKKWDKVKTKVK